MIIHMFPKSQFTECCVCFINKYFDKKEHLFLLYTNKEFAIPDYLYTIENVIDYDKKDIFWLYRVLKKADKIFLHNLSVNIRELFLFSICRTLTRKVTWLVWGVDLYCYRNKRDKLMDKLVEAMRRSVIRQIPVIATLADGDYDLAREWYGTKARHIRLDYCDEKEIGIFQYLRKQPDEKKENVNILIGNSATRTNCHIEAFEFLKKFKEENICLYVPLSYGDMEYAKEVEKAGYTVFGDKFIPLKEYMSQEEYFGLLNKMDIAVFNNDRQQAIGNITALLYLGKKLYLRKDTAMWNEWVKKQKYAIHSTEDIVREDYAQFTSNDKAEADINYKLTKEFFNAESRRIEWKAAFNM